MPKCNMYIVLTRKANLYLEKKTNHDISFQEKKTNQLDNYEHDVPSIDISALWMLKRALLSHHACPISTS